MTEVNPIVIETHNLSKNYDGVQALTNLNLKVRKNSIFGFLGPNGAGKTTTIKLLLGLINPTEGGGVIFDRNITRESIQVRQRVGYLPQNPEFYENMTARQILEFSLKFYYQGSHEAIQNRIEEILKLVELEDKANRPIKGYSGGERQRLGIGQSVIHKPDLLILDEPTASLDPIGRHSVLNLMTKLQEETTIFYSTHILDDVQRVSDTVAILNHGKLVAQGAIQELIAGKEGIIYTVKIKNASERIQKSLLKQQWITDIQSEISENAQKWYINISDEDQAEKNLLRLLLKDDNVSITEFYRKKYELEDIFLKVIEEDEDVSK
ncbi:MAG: ATP-binding cassette domain-containing protein [Candidatus Lokiarchaeota archaeon]|nr:ATP-binding cassette domain-containing protein [Candidatus Lokiarchaeota archaeon]MBD3200960.1 ATP-binding cassette domain-containing protein [Candidatus Lokiarchaeota archaeon]